MLHTQLHHFIVKLPPLLREKLQDKQHEFKSLSDAFDKVVTLVNNRPELAKFNAKERTEVPEGGKAKSVGHKRKYPEGQSKAADWPSRAKEEKAHKANKLRNGMTPGQKAKRDALIEKRRAEGLCFKCGASDHQSRECPTKRGNPGPDAGKKGDKVSVTLSNLVVANGETGVCSAPKIQVSACKVRASPSRDDPDKLMFIGVVANGVKCVAMLDTAATTCFVSNSSLSRLGMNAEELLQPLVCKFANDSRGVVSMVINKLQIKILKQSRNFVSQERCLVMDGLAVDLILSIGYFRKHNVTLKPGEGWISFPDKGGEPIIVHEITENKEEFLQVSKVSWVSPNISAKQWWKDFKGGFDCFFFHLHPTLEVEVQPKSKLAKVDPDYGRIPELLEEFSDVFSQKLPVADIDYTQVSLGLAYSK
ncbi:retropepsin-like aspartic protease, partial [Acinetobacter nosocomialis]|uniref:retropepsin-like aspartic protease n=1 Tax=Acinetobacter nosocomialis TaxID=106654 RepID=UPI00374EED4D